MLMLCPWSCCVAWNCCEEHSTNRYSEQERVPRPCPPAHPQNGSSSKWKRWSNMAMRGIRHVTCAFVWISKSHSRRSLWWLLLVFSLCPLNTAQPHDPSPSLFKRKTSYSLHPICVICICMCIYWSTGTNRSSHIYAYTCMCTYKCTQIHRHVPMQRHKRIPTRIIAWVCA